jgi:hypothetical protein
MVASVAFIGVPVKQFYRWLGFGNTSNATIGVPVATVALNGAKMPDSCRTNHGSHDNAC